MPLIIPGTPSQGWIVLIGGGEFSFGETREFDEFAISKMPSAKRSIAFLPTASGSNEYALHLGKYMRTLDESVNVVNVPIYRHRDARREKNLATIRDAGMVYVGGGVTNALAEACEESAVAEALREAVRRGAVLVAIGAGASALGVATRDMRVVGNAITGLGVIDGIVETAFDPASDTMLKHLVSRPEARFGVGIPRGTALAIAPDHSTQILGDGQIAFVRKPETPAQ